MSTYFKAIDRFAAKLTQRVLQRRWLAIVVAVLIAVAAGAGASKLEFSSNYRVFFSDANPELTAFENLQNTYTKNDNFLFVIQPQDGDAFSSETLAAVEALTDAAWQIPYAIRVDSVTNFQHTYAIEDDLIVEDLVQGAERQSADFLTERREVALAEPLIRNQLLTGDADVTAVNVVLQYPEASITEVPEAVTVARDLRASIEAQYPHLEIQLTGVSMLNNAFAETGMNDGATLMPLMFAVIFGVTWLIIRSFSATFSTIIVIMLSSVVGMGMAGYAGVKLTPISMSAPIVILTLAVADSIHILLSLRGLMREGMAKHAAIVEAVRINFLPVSITSLTTIVGFLALNFSDSPPYWHLGNITAVGIAAAWLYSITLLPALLSVLPYSTSSATEKTWSQRAMSGLAEFVIVHSRKLLIGVGAAALLVVSFIPMNDFNDQWVEYFDERVEFRTDSDAAMEHFGMYPIEFSVPAANTGGVSEPEYLANLDKFAEFLREQPEVAHVYTLSDIMKRLNRNMHADDAAYYRTPADRELSAQYLLLYELSLPYGLDLNDRINIDKSASRVTATLGRISTEETRQLLQRVDGWMADNWPSYMQADPTSASVMFAYIAERNVENMITGTVLAIIAISLIMMFALRSFALGLLSLVPNGLPILVTFGTWALLVGEVGFSVATVASISLGIIVDDTVHFLSKYVRARDERGLSAEDSIRYAFENVGMAIVVNTIILAIGFFVMTVSAFKPNFDMGLMTVIAIVFALVLDFLLLPALLLLGKKGREGDAADATGNSPKLLPSTA
ncbi:MAG: efflux RND transporter permease subunit [Woeseiaceae bacterium]